MKIKLFVLSFFLFSTVAFAGSMDSYSVFKTRYEPVMPEFVVPTLVEVTFPSLGFPSVQKLGIAIVESEGLSSQPWRSLTNYAQFQTKTLDTSALIGKSEALVDDDYRTVAEFDLDKDDGFAYMIVETSKEIEASYLYLSLDDFVALPYEFALSAEVEGNWKTVVAQNKLRSERINFPSTVASKWKLEFWHSQPLRLRGIDLFGEGEFVSGRSFVWLAKPGVKYKIYSDAEAFSGLKVGESPNLYPEKDEEILAIDLGEEIPNELYRAPDADKDGIADKLDNCVHLSNFEQGDLDKDGKGDVCDDDDRDGIMNSKDNCPNDANKRQKDEDGDGIGDVCDDEESRITEKFTWLPWATMGVVSMILVIVMIGIFRKHES